ncbi:MAG: DUF4837 family protein [Bacteroidales bacterium]|nr:DUF4837 family protein [Bacteroidales bacterium]
MKKVYYLFILPILFMIFSCNNSSYKKTPVAHGSFGDIVVVMNNEHWNSEPGDSLRAIFHQYCPANPLEEYVFDLHQISKDKFIDQNLYHRNVIFQEIDSNIEEAKLNVIVDKYAQNQVFVSVVAPNQAEFVKEISKHRNNLIKLFLEADRDRWIGMFTRNVNKTVSDKILKKYDISIKLPINYYLDVYDDNFAWISHESRQYSMAFFIYTYPLTDSSEFTSEYLIQQRNKMLKENVPGSRPGSYMTTEVKYDYPLLETIKHNGLETAVMRGLWKVKGDFMGGPFVSYTKMDKSRNRMVCVEAYVYYPNEETRDKMRQLEGVIYTFDIVK